jgi:hypothetical protein
MLCDGGATMSAQDILAKLADLYAQQKSVKVKLGEKQ